MALHWGAARKVDPIVLVALWESAARANEFGSPHVSGEVSILPRRRPNVVSDSAGRRNHGS